MIAAPIAFYRSADGLPLCPHCQHWAEPWPATFDDVQAADRCGLGYICRGGTAVCFGYERLIGADDVSPAILVTLNSAASPEPECAWQDRVDGMRLRKPKS